MNQLELSGRLLQRETLRYTPAGVAVVEAVVHHESELIEAGAARQVSVDVDAIAVGALALRLGATPLGAALKLTGFIAQRSRRSRRLRVHITDFESGE